jgi:hypothetical protein
VPVDSSSIPLRGGKVDSSNKISNSKISQIFKQSKNNCKPQLILPPKKIVEERN